MGEHVGVEDSSLAYPRFPSQSDSRVVLSRLRRRSPATVVVVPAGQASEDENNEDVRGVEGLRPGVISFPWVEIDQAPNGDFQPLACIATEDAIAFPGACYVSLDALDRCTWWLTEITFAGTGSQPIVPPQIDYDIRATVGGCSDSAILGVTAFNRFQDRGLLAAASGILCSQWELWARIVPAEPAGSKLRIKASGAADRLGGGAFVTGKGILSA